MSSHEAVAVLSGGMDSTVAVYQLKSHYPDIHLLSFNYGQRHKKELEYAKLTAEALGFRHDIVDLSGVAKLFSGSSLTDGSVDVPEGHYAEDNMKLTVVPNRNMIMLSIAFGVAISDKAAIVTTGVHAGDHAIYPDCRPKFIEDLNAALTTANEGFTRPGLFVWAPFMNISKADIVSIGHNLDVPFQNTWSCYKGGEVHCGICGTCYERREAFELANVEDPTQYDPANDKKYHELRKIHHGGN